LRTFRTLALTGLMALSTPAWAGDFVDTRLSFVFADDNIFADAGETTPNSPSARFGAGNQNTQFYDNFNTRFSGFETLSNIVLYKRMPSFFEGLTTEAALTVLMLERPSGGIELRDTSSYIRLHYKPRGWGENEGLSLTGFPVSADRFRLGYAYRITWGGSGVFTTRATAAGVPGAKLQLTRDNWYAFVGGKTALVLNDLIREQETLYGFLAGAGWDPMETLRLEASGGYFQKGIVPGLAALGVEAPVNSAGVSAQAVYHVGVPVGTSIDLRLYRNDPELYQRFFAPEQYPGGLAYSVSLEGSYLVQTLSDPDRFGATVPQEATAVALQARARLDSPRRSASTAITLRASGSPGLSTSASRSSTSASAGRSSPMRARASPSRTCTSLGKSRRSTSSRRSASRSAPAFISAWATVRRSEGPGTDCAAVRSSSSSMSVSGSPASTLRRSCSRAERSMAGTLPRPPRLTPQSQLTEYSLSSTST